MIKVAARQNCRALLRRLSIGNGQTRPRAAVDSHRVVQSPLRDAGFAHRNRSTRFVIPSIATQTSVHCASATNRQRRNPHSV
jgi:hypothetical protein